MDAKWKGTPVPTEGYIEKIYVNTELSVEEVMNLLSKLPCYESNGFTYYIADSGPLLLMCMYSPEGPSGVPIGAIGIRYAGSGQRVTVFQSEPMEESFVGWESFDNPIEFNSENTANGVFQDIGITPVHEILSSLFSITPFEKVEDKPENPNVKEFRSKTTIIKNPGSGSSGGASVTNVDTLPNDWNGTAVPNTGYVENVYINTNLSNEDVIEIVKNLNYDFTNDDYYVFITADADNPIGMGLYCEENGDGSTYCEIYVMKPASNGGFPIFDTEDGWYDFDNPIGFNDNALDGSAEGFLWGDQNALLAALFSITPFDYKPVTVNESALYRTPDGSLYSYKSNKFVKLITSDDNIGTDPEVLDAIDDLYSNYDSLNSTVNSIKSVNDSQGTSITNLNTKVGTLETKTTNLETQIGNINTILDSINGEEV